jgi:hypothetical protein
MGGYYNPLTGQLMGMGGMGSAFEDQSGADEEALQDQMFEEGQDRAGRGRTERFAQKAFYYSKLPEELPQTVANIGRVGKLLSALGLPGGKALSNLSTKATSILKNSGFGAAGAEAGAEASASAGAGVATNAVDGFVKSAGGIDVPIASDVGAGILAGGAESAGVGLAGAGLVAGEGGILAGLGGMLGGAGAGIAGMAGMAGATAPILLPIIAALGAYKIGSNIVQTGQQYGTLTGTDSAAGGYGAKAQAFLGSFLNPLMPSGVSQQIESTGLASGYQFGTPYLNQYRDFASGAYERFGINPQEAQQMFQAAVVNAGGSANYLSQSLQQVGQHAADAGVSFKELTNNFSSALQNYAGMGFSGNTATVAAQVSTGMFLGGTQQQNQILQGTYQNTFSPFFGSMMGQGILAQQLGTNLSGLYATEQKMGAAAGTGVPLAEAGYVKHLLSGMGMSTGHTEKNLASDFYALQSMGLNFGSYNALGAFANEAFNTNDFTKGAIASIAKPNKQSFETQTYNFGTKAGDYTSYVMTAQDQKKYNAAMAQYNQQVATAKTQGGKLNASNLATLQNAFSGAQSGSSVNAGGVQITLSPSAQKLIGLNVVNSAYGATPANAPYALPAVGAIGYNGNV